MATKRQQQETQRAAEKSGTDPIVMAAAASVLLSQYLFFVKGDRDMGLFVGLWPPTLFAFTSYFHQRKVENVLERQSDSVVTRVQRVLKEE